MNHLQELIDWFEHLSPATVDRVPDFYAANAEFKDPFNEVRGTEAIARIFGHMFTQVDEPRFVIDSRFSGEDGVMLLWDFHFRTRGRRPQAIRVRGASHLRFDAAGKVVLHRDYWDTAEELYAKLPLLGAPMRFLQRMGRA
ncbi:nuclear transport factor 2 family protein [Sulfuritalea sp.]|uniref:nuclear transport factor 2 family protein n=1 Tax=Sulfuritalea sp. TaxID=2480090 RepID=UPI0025DEFCBC|nr:nuclear transport factor 2 family protein [Sulfuritalea sp.]